MSGFPPSSSGHGESLFEISNTSTVHVLATFTDGKHIVGGGDDSVRIWRVVDGQEVGAIPARNILSIAVSYDDKLIVAGTYSGVVTVWDAQRLQEVFAYDGDTYSIGAVDFSPDSTRLVTASDNRTVCVWDIITGRRLLGPFLHDYSLFSAKFSPQGDRIATATIGPGAIRVYDSHDGHLLANINIKITLRINAALAWTSDGQSIFAAVSDSTIKRFEVDTGSIISEGAIHAGSSIFASVCLSTNGKFMVHSANRLVTIWSAITHIQLGPAIEFAQNIRAIALSPDNQFLAASGDDGKIVIKHLWYIGVPSSYLTPNIQLPLTRISKMALESWMQGDVKRADDLLSKDISLSLNYTHYALANRALLGACTKQWDRAGIDAEKSIETRPSAIGLVARSVILVGKGRIEKAFEAIDLAFAYCDLEDIKFLLLIKSVILSLSGQPDMALSRMSDLLPLMEDKAMCLCVQSQMHILLGDSYLHQGLYEQAIKSFECAKEGVQYHPSPYLSIISLISGWKFIDTACTVRQRICEALYIAGRPTDAAESFIQMTDMFSKGSRGNESNTKWVADFTKRCALSLVSLGNNASKAVNYEEAVTYYATALRLDPSTASLKSLLIKWVKAKLVDSSWEAVLGAANEFQVQKFTVFQVVGEVLADSGHINEATKCIREIKRKYTGEKISTLDREQGEWILAFTQRCVVKLESFGDVAAIAERYDDAIDHYSNALSLKPCTLPGLFLKRSKARAARRLWEEALLDANQAISLDPSSPSGYERKYVALHGAGRHSDAVNTCKEMISKISESPNPHIWGDSFQVPLSILIPISGFCINEDHRQYIDPSITEAKIRRAIQRTIRNMPRILINASTGRLCDKIEQALTFESLPIFHELISSMTTHNDRTRIKQEVEKYYRYVMLSHRWENNEPLFQQVAHTSVYDLHKSPTNDKLRRFCELVRDAGFNWAWSDTCCIDKQDHFVLQEALFAMFKWYRGSTLTIVFLRGVRSSSRPGDLARSIWSTRAWTFQEYVAAKVIQFYTEDWTPYLNLGIPNHKESLAIITEMEEVTGVSAAALRALRPGLGGISDKLRLASARQTTLTEDTAYSLLGIFSAPIPVMYGEGNSALGRLLAHVLSGSGNVTVLAWIGESGTFNSCLPAHITVFGRRSNPHFPQPLEETELATAVTSLRTSSLNLDVALRLYNRLNEVSTPWFAASRMKLPCVIFALGPLSAYPIGSSRVYRADTAAFGVVDIKTRQNLAQMNSLYLVHPWLDSLLDRDLAQSSVPTIQATPSLPPPYTAYEGSAVGDSSDGETMSLALSEPETVVIPQPRAAPMDRETRALRLVARLRQPFGALLLSLAPTRPGAVEYKRVATDRVITVQLQESVPLTEVLDGVRILDVL